MLYEGGARLRFDAPHHAPDMLAVCAVSFTPLRFLHTSQTRRHGPMTASRRALSASGLRNQPAPAHGREACSFTPRYSLSAAPESNTFEGGLLGPPRLRAIPRGRSDGTSAHRPDCHVPSRADVCVSPSLAHSLTPSLIQESRCAPLKDALRWVYAAAAAGEPA